MRLFPELHVEEKEQNPKDGRQQEEPLIRPNISYAAQAWVFPGNANLLIGT
jgi:hypothetical protein